MNQINNTNWQLQVEILTPVHVGAGNDLLVECDFFKKDTTAFVVDQNHLFQALASSGLDLSALLAKTYQISELFDALSETQQESQYHYQLKTLDKATTIPSERIAAYVKDSFLRPYIPGASIKGAIRTALLTHIIKSNGFSSIESWLPQERQHYKLPRKSQAAAKLTEKLFSSKSIRGQVPNFDLLRTIHISDSYFTTDALTIAEVRWLNLVGKPLQAKWRDMAKQQSVANWKDAMGTFTESLSPEKTGILNVQIDNFLLENETANSVLQWQPKKIPTQFDQWRQIINNHALQRLEEEKAFFKEYQVTGALTACEKILQQIHQTPEACYLQIGWGSGWESMTGNWLPENIKQDMRHHYGLGKRIRDEYERSVFHPVFPKTRRLIINDGHPCLPFGWIRLFSPEISQQRIAKENEIKQQAQLEAEKQALQLQQAQEEAERQAQIEAQRKAEMTPLELSIEEILAAETATEQADYITLLQALAQGKWEDEADQQAVAQAIQQQMEQAKVWKETTSAKNPDKDKNYKRTQEVLKYLRR